MVPSPPHRALREIAPCSGRAGTCARSRLLDQRPTARVRPLVPFVRLGCFHTPNSGSDPAIVGSSIGDVCGYGGVDSHILSVAGPEFSLKWLRSASAPGGLASTRCISQTPNASEAALSQVRVHNFSISLDGFGTGEGITFDAPFGHAGHRLHEWYFAT